MVELKLTESTTEVLNFDSEETVAVAALFVGRSCLGWIGDKQQQLSRETALPQVTKLSKRSLHLHGVSCFSQSIFSLDVSLRSRSEICRFDLTVHFGQPVFQGRGGHLSLLANVALHAHYGNGDNVFTPCPVWYNVIKQDNNIAVFVHDHIVDFR